MNSLQFLFLPSPCHSPHTQLPADHKISFMSGAVFIRFQDKVVMLQTHCGYTGGVKRTWEGFICHHSTSPICVIGKIRLLLYGKWWSTDCKHPHFAKFPTWFLWLLKCKCDISKCRHSDMASAFLTLNQTRLTCDTYTDQCRECLEPPDTSEEDWITFIKVIVNQFEKKCKIKKFLIFLETTE